MLRISTLSCAVACLLIAGCDEGRDSTARIDGTTQATFQASREEVERGMSGDERAESIKAMGVLSLDIKIDQPETAATDAEAALRKAIHGKTADEIIAMADESVER